MEEYKKKKLGYEFHRQVIIDNFIVDFYCHELSLAIEVDGSSHDEKEEYDEERDSIIRSLGVHILRVLDVDVKRRMDCVIQNIQNTTEELTS